MKSEPDMTWQMRTLRRQNQATVFLVYDLPRLWLLAFDFAEADESRMWHLRWISWLSRRSQTRWDRFQAHTFPPWLRSQSWCRHMPRQRRALHSQCRGGSRKHLTVPATSKQTTSKQYFPLRIPALARPPPHAALLSALHFLPLESTLNKGSLSSMLICSFGAAFGAASAEAALPSALVSSDADGSGSEQSFSCMSCHNQFQHCHHK